MQPSQARKRILEEHLKLRQRLASLEAKLEGLRADPSRLAAISEAASTLLNELVEHTELEEAVLGPVLLEVDAWGHLRERSLRDHHTEQRALLRALLDAYSDARADPDWISNLTRDWIRDVRADMHHEERDLLTANLLRDDIIAVEMECG